MALPLSLRMQGFFLGAALGELYSYGLLTPEQINPSATPLSATDLPFTQQLYQLTRAGLQTSACFWTANVLQALSQQSLYLNAAIFPLLYPGSPIDLLSHCESLSCTTPPSETPEQAIALSYAIALALQTPLDLAILQSKVLRRFNTTPYQILDCVLRTPTDFPCSLQQMQQYSAANPLALTLTGALSGSLNMVSGFPLSWLTTLSTQPYPDWLGQHTWLETITSLANDCMTQWSGQLQPSTAQSWTSVAIAPANQLRPRT